jgi:hypothetical protein
MGPDTQESRRIQTDPVTGKVKIDVVTMESKKVVIDEEALLRKKEYLEESISNYQAELTYVNQQLNEVNDAKAQR